MKWQRELDLAVSAVQSAAACLGSRFVSGAGVCSLEGKDIKTDADVEAEAEILRHLRVTAFPIVAEESSAARVGGSGVHWLVDPLDGTMNFARGFPMHAVSVALWDGMTPLLGAIYDLPRRALYTGVIGSGAWRDGRPIVVSDTAEKSQAILATGFPTGREYGSGALGDFIARVQASKKSGHRLGDAVASDGVGRDVRRLFRGGYHALGRGSGHRPCGGSRRHFRSVARKSTECGGRFREQWSNYFQLTQ